MIYVHHYPGSITNPELPFVIRFNSIQLVLIWHVNICSFTEGPCSTEGLCLLFVIYRGVYPTHVCLDHVHVTPTRLAGPISRRPAPPCLSTVPGPLSPTLCGRKQIRETDQLVFSRDLYQLGKRWDILIPVLALFGATRGVDPVTCNHFLNSTISFTNLSNDHS